MEAVVKKKTVKAPSVRFDRFNGDWSVTRLGTVVEAVGEPVALEDTKVYREIGIRSHGRGIFHKDPITGKQLGDKRCFWVEKDALVFNIVFAWEQAVALTTDAEDGFIASHRFPMYHAVPTKARVEFLHHLFLSQKGKWLLGSASPGGAGRNKTLGNKAFADLKVTIPGPDEQQKIAAFLSAVDAKVRQLTRKQALLEQYKKGVMQQLFSRALRFKRKDGTPSRGASATKGAAYPEWEEKRLGEIVTFTKGKGVSKGDIVEGGATKCIRYGELYTTYGEVIDEVVSTTDVNPSLLLLSKKNDVIIPASGETQLDIATASCVMHDGIALGGDLNVMRTQENGVFLAYYLNGARRNQIAELAQGNAVVHLYPRQLQDLSIDVPSLEEQQRIAGFLMALDAKVAMVANEVEAAQRWKKGLLQQMFV